MRCARKQSQPKLLFEIHYRLADRGLGKVDSPESFAKAFPLQQLP